MSVRLCLVPVIGVGTLADSRRPKYFRTVDVPEALSGTDFGFEPWYLGSSDLSAPSLTFLQAQADAFVIPEDLDASLTGGQVTTTQTALEAMNVPAEWVTTAFTWRQVIRIVLGVFRYMARFAVVYATANGSATTRVFTGGVDLSRTYSSLSLAVRTALTATATSLALDTTGITGASTLRVILKSVGTQLAATALTVGAMKI